jgi:class 3 adenylate cyclase
MTDALPGAISNRLKEISSELREIELALKAGPAPDLLLLQEFRHVLDNARLTAWTVSELLNAVESQKDPANVLSFVAAERLRRSNQMLKDLCTDIDRQGVTWQTNGIQALFETVNSLQMQLRKLVEEHRGRFERVGDRFGR